MDSCSLYSLYLLNNEPFLYSFFISYKSHECNIVALTTALDSVNVVIELCHHLSTSWVYTTILHLNLKSVLEEKVLVHKFLSFQYGQ